AEQQIISKASSISQCEDRSEHCAIEGDHVESAEAEDRSQSKRIESHANVVREDLARAYLIRFVQIFPPMRAMVDYDFAKEGTNTGEFRKIRIVPRSEKSNRGEQPEDRECGRGIAPGAPKRPREIAREKVANALAAFRIRAINPSMSANHQAIQIINQSRVARLSTGDRQVRSGAAIDAAQLAHLFPMKLSERHTIEKLQQLFEPLPDCLAFLDEAIDGHCSLPIADFRFLISDLQSES